MAFWLSTRLWSKKAQDRLPAGPTIVERFRVTLTTNGKQQTWTGATWPSFPFTRVTLFFHIKRCFTLLSSMRIVLDCSYRLIVHFEKFSTWVCRLRLTWLTGDSISLLIPMNGYSVILFLSRKWKNRKPHLTATFTDLPPSSLGCGMRDRTTNGGGGGGVSHLAWDIVSLCACSHWAGLCLVNQ